MDSQPRRWLRVPPRDWLVLAQLACAALAVRAFLSSRRLRGLTAILVRTKPGHDSFRFPLGASRLSQDRLIHLADRAARLVARRAPCLVRSFLLAGFFSGSGEDVGIRIGVHKEGATLRAHAWLEQGGSPVGEPQGRTEGFLPLARLGTR